MKMEAKRRQSVSNIMASPRLVELTKQNNMNHDDILKVSFDFDKLKKVLQQILTDIRIHGEKFN